MAVKRSREPIYSLTISTLGGVAGARIEGQHITGRWKEHTELIEWNYLHREYSPAELFLNWKSDPDSILEFVLKYGPVGRDQLWKGKGSNLKLMPVVPSGGAKFRLELDSWRKWREWLRMRWRRGSESGANFAWQFQTLHGEILTFDSTGKMGFTALNPTRFVDAVLQVCPPTRKRICPRCKTYFIARHKKAIYCSEPCRDDAQREYQLKWWHENRSPKAMRNTKARKGKK